MTNRRDKAKYKKKTVISRNNMLRNRTSSNKHKVGYQNFVPALNLLKN